MEYRIDDLLADGRKILQPKNGYHFTSDSARLANFIKFKESDKIAELCAGCGIIGILLAMRGTIAGIHMVELQKSLAKCCQENIKLNGFEDKIKILNSKLQGCSDVLGKGVFDIVACNPPFEKFDPRFKVDEINIAKFEFKATFEEIVKEANLLLKKGGRFFFVFPAARLFEAAGTLNKFDFKIKECSLFFPSKKQKDQGENPLADTVYICAAKGRKDGVKIRQI